MHESMKYFWTKWLSLALINAAFIGSAQNLPPVITFSVPSPQQVEVGSNFTFTVTVTDPEGITPILAVTNWPPPSHFNYGETLYREGRIDASFGCVIASGAQFGSPYEIIFTASDGVNLPVSKTMTIVVIATNALPIALTNAAFQAGQFHFEITGATPKGTTSIIQASTNLIDWVSIGTNGFGIDQIPGYFTDPESTNFVRRFYRVLQTNFLISPDSN
jgi:hypothetical protein